MRTGKVLSAAVGALVAVSIQGAASTATPQGGVNRSLVTTAGDAALSVRKFACLKVLKPLAPDAVPTTNSFEPVDCADTRPAAAFRYDRVSRSTRLARAVARNDIVPVYPEFGIDMVQPGQMLRLVIASGVVRIERRVEAMQTARPGQRLFVRSSDGEILSVRYEEAAQ